MNVDRGLDSFVGFLACWRGEADACSIGGQRLSREQLECTGIRNISLSKNLSMKNKDMVFVVSVRSCMLMTRSFVPGAYVLHPGNTILVSNRPASNTTSEMNAKSLQPPISDYAYSVCQL
jgi:hypothetical protein